MIKANIAALSFNGMRHEVYQSGVESSMLIVQQALPAAAR
jgi:hypothetical protein